jgi:LruC domain-containing protein
MEGDYDMNDVVFHYRTVTVMRESKLQRVDVYGQLVAIGASYHNGFAIRVPGVQASAVDTSKMRFRYAIDGLAGIEQVNSPIEAESDELIAIISQDVWQLVDTNCTFYRTDDDCQDDIQFEFELSLPFTELQEASTIGTLYDPFIFASENRFHGSVFNGFPGRNLEIHLADISPTEQANTSYFGLEQDASNIAGSRYYKNANNLPWSMEVGTSWKHPRSGKDLLEAYPFFENYVTSNKEDNSDWYIPENGNSNKVYD